MNKFLWIIIYILIFVNLAGLALTITAYFQKKLSSVPEIKICDPKIRFSAIKSSETITTLDNTSAKDIPIPSDAVVSAAPLSVAPETTILPTEDSTNPYPIHQQITTTVFWVGEESTFQNNFISNADSAWDSLWQEHFGGIDSPISRNGYCPLFQPNENPFYIALPYNDLDGNGNRKANAQDVIYWSKDKAWQNNESMVKNQWLKITKNDLTVYAQLEDAGPFFYDDSNYVFGNARPINQANNNAGIDVSPAVKDYLGLNDIDQVSWQFIEEKDVPNGPWKEIVTTSLISF